MKGEQFEGRLLLVLIIFSISIGILHGRKNGKIEGEQFDIVHNFTEISPLSQNEVLDYLRTLIIAHNLPLVGQFIAQFPDKIAKNLFQKIIESKEIPLTSQEAIQLLFSVAYHLSEKKRAQFSWFDLLLRYPAMQKEPIALLLARGPYPDIIPEFLQWLRIKITETKNKKFLTKLITHSLEYAIDENDFLSFELLTTKKLRIASPQASHLLRHAVTKNKNTQFVPFFVQRGADINYVDEQGMSLLMHAVKQNNVAMVRALLEAGALVDLVADPAIGMALQIAIENDYQPIIVLLQEYSSAQ